MGAKSNITSPEAPNGTAEIELPPNVSSPAPTVTSPIFESFNFTFNLQPSELYLPDDISDDVSDLLRPSNASSTTPAPLSCIYSSSTGTGNSSCLWTDHTQTRIFSEDDLWAENEHFARVVSPAMVFIGILLVMGTVGNLLVVYVYGFKFKPATQHFLIVCLACFDLLMCTIAMPTEIADMRFHHTFHSVFACKLLRFITMFSSISSSFTLVTIALDRHRRVTRPLTKQITVKKAKYWEILNVLMALFFSWPTLVLTGLRSSETRVPGLLGRDCSFSDRYTKTKFPLAYNVVLVLGFFVLISTIGVIYFRVWKTVRGHRVYMARRPHESVSCTSAVYDVRVDTEHAQRKRVHRNNSEDAEGALRYNNLLEKSSNNETKTMLCTIPASLNDEVLSNCETAVGSVTSISTTTTAATPTKQLLSSSLSLPLKAKAGKYSNGMEGRVPYKTKETDNEKNVSTFERKSRSLRFYNVICDSLHVSSLYDSTSETSSLSAKSQSPSPVIRPKMLKPQRSLSLSVQSEDFRPMSSLLEAVSKSLVQSGSCPNVISTAMDKAEDCSFSTVHETDQRPCDYGDTDSQNASENVSPLLKGTTSTDMNAIPSTDRPGVCEGQCELNSEAAPSGRNLDDSASPVCIASHEDCGNSEVTDAKSATDIVTQRTYHSEGGTCILSDPPPIHMISDGKNQGEILRLFVNAQDYSYNKNGNPWVPEKGDSIPEKIYKKSITKGPEPIVKKKHCRVKYWQSCRRPFPHSKASIKRASSLCGYNNDTKKLSLDSNDCFRGCDVSNETVLNIDFLLTMNATDIDHLRGPTLTAMKVPRDCLSDEEDDAVRAESLEEKGVSSWRDAEGRPRSSSSEYKLRSSSSATSLCSQHNQSNALGSALDVASRSKSVSMASLDNLASVSSTQPVRGRRVDKTTIVAFAVSSVFALSFLPYLTLMFIRAFVRDFDYSLNDGALLVYNIFVRFYFLNSAANPVLYGLLNERFRNEVIKLLSCCGKKKMKKTTMEA